MESNNHFIMVLSTGIELHASHTVSQVIIYSVTKTVKL